jgi:hypothetical protein
MHDLEITFDFDEVKRSADRVRAMLLDIRSKFDISAFEYTTRVRIAPLEIPHSHPVLTLNTWVRDEAGLLSTYIHEQMHWYLTWFSYALPDQWKELFRALRQRYPEVPVGTPEAAPDEFSIYLHLVINWLEIDITSQFIDRDRVVEHVRGLPFYRWMYRVVVNDFDSLGELFREHGVLPVKPATKMSAAELQTAALATESPTS